MIYRAVTLAWWSVLWLIPGGLRWRYWRGGWIREFDDALPVHPYGMCVESVQQFESLRRNLSREHHEWLRGLALPSRDNAESLWAHPASRNHTFSFIGRRELHPLRFLRLMRWLPWFNARILEFGAGAAPLAHGVTKAWPLPVPRIDVADIDWPLRDYCERRFAGGPLQVHVIAVETIPDRVRTHGPYDAIVCLETLEHVPDPEQTADQMVRWLTEGGVLLWDYCEQEKDQPLAPKGKSARDATIALLEKRLDLIHGPDSRGLRVSRKRQTRARDR